MKNINNQIINLVSYFINIGYANNEDFYYLVNKISNKFNIVFSEEYIKSDFKGDVVKLINDIGIALSKIENIDSDICIDSVMGLIMPSPELLRLKMKDRKIIEKYKKLYILSKNYYYIKTDRIEKNKKWDYSSKFGNLVVTINNSKPEKTTKQIEEALKSPYSNFPKCKLCFENIGFANKTYSRENLRAITFELGGEKVFSHFSPYEYFNEHIIVSSMHHERMSITKNTFDQMTDFMKLNDDYFISTNADLPIVGGSILSHKHYQGGGADLPIFNAKTIFTIEDKNVVIEFIDWPLSTLKVSSKDFNVVSKIAYNISSFWNKYSDEKHNIFNSEKQRHNTMTIIGKKMNGIYTYYLIFRNNKTSDDFPEGIFHTKKDKWNIKQENIGVIEAAGILILPGRLTFEIQEIMASLYNGSKELPSKIAVHKEWYKYLLKNYSKSQNIKKFMQLEIGKIVESALLDCRVLDKHNMRDFIDKFMSKEQ